MFPPRRSTFSLQEENTPQRGPRVRRRRPRDQRLGTTLVEFAFVFPVFLLFVFALIEYGHTLMVANMVTSIAKQAAHRGSFEGTSTADVQTFASSKISGVVPGSTATIAIKDASTFELSTTDPSDVVIEDLPNIELSGTESRQLFLVHIEVPYEDVALFPPFWVRDLVLRGDSIMRRE